MAPVTASDFIPFKFEPERRSDRYGSTPVAAAASPKAPEPTDQQRSAPNPRDIALSALAKTWCDRLPPAQQPHALCTQYARIANRIALCWADPVLSRMLLKDLLVDKRGGRKGFPAAVQAELVVLASCVGFELPRETAYRLW